MDKEFDFLLSGTLPLSPPPESLHHLVHILHIFGRYLQTSRDLCPKSYKRCLRMANAASLLSFEKCSMPSCARAYERSDEEEARRYRLGRIMNCSKATEWDL